MINISAPQVKDETEATKLMVYHLHTAACLFEATHDDRGRTANEMLKSLPDGWREAASCFVDLLCTHYENLPGDDK